MTPTHDTHCILTPQSPYSPEFRAAWRIYEAAFPTTERRTWAQQVALMTREPRYRVQLIRLAEHVVGLLTWWDFDDWTYVEHFALSPDVQGMGLGSQTLSDFIATAPRPLLLEVEPPHTAEQQARVRFYQRLGLTLHHAIAYTQPPYQAGQPAIALCVMTTQPNTTAEAVATFVRAYHPIIYPLYNNP